MDPDVVILPDPEALANKAAQIFVDSAVEGIRTRNRFSVALSGGSTPLTLYSLLAEEPYRDQIPWSGAHLFWGDERRVPPDSDDSNYYQAHKALISQVPIPAENVHRIAGEMEPAAAARAYDHQLQEFFCGLHPRFDLVLLGLGEDGHTASLFPRSPAPDEKLVVAATAFYQDRPPERVTLTPKAINTTRHALFLVTGSPKAAIVRAVLEGPKDRYPAQRIRPTAGQLTWLLDEAAASLLSRTKPTARGR